MTIKRKPKRSTARSFLNELAGPLTFANLLTATREAEGWSMVVMARKLDISRSHLNDIEKGRKAVSVTRAARFARALGYDVATFVQLALQGEVTAAGLKLRVTVD